MEENVIMKENKKPHTIQLTLSIADKERNNNFLEDLLMAARKFCKYVCKELLPNIPVFLQHYASTIDHNTRDAFKKQIIVNDPLEFSRYISAETRESLINDVAAKINECIREDGEVYLSPNDIYINEFKLRPGFQAIQYKNGKFYLNINDKLIGPLYSSYNTLDSFILLLLYHSHVEIKDSLYFKIEERDWDEVGYVAGWTQFRLRINIPIHYIKEAIEILKTKTDKDSKLLIKRYYAFINIDKTTKKMRMEDDADIDDDDSFDDSFDDADDWDDDFDEDDSFVDEDDWANLEDEDYDDDEDDIDEDCEEDTE